jgi:hypothetical protein
MASIRSFSRTPDRTLHLVDLDNLVGGPRHADLVDDVIGQYAGLAGIKAGDHLVVGADASLAGSAAFRVPVGTRFLVGRGPDGADRRLLEAATAEHISRRYGRLVVGSGDHAFEGLLRSVSGYGIPVMVIARAMSMARCVRLAADSYRLLRTA